MIADSSFYEGFGLPIIEAINRNALVIALVREAGMDFCKYFSLADNGEFIELMSQFVSGTKVVEQVKEKIKHYVTTI